MPLSADEIAAAKKAFSEMRAYNMRRTSSLFTVSLLVFFVFAFGISIACGLTVTDLHGQNLSGWPAALSMLSLLFQVPCAFFVLMALTDIYRSFREKRRHTENLELITRIEQKHISELPYGLEQELERVPYKPERRPLLWRLDALLSRKQADR